MLSTSSGSEVAAAAASARRSRGRGRTPRGSGNRGTGRRGSGSGGGDGGDGGGCSGGDRSGSGGSGKKKMELKSTLAHHAGRQSRKDRYAAAVAKGQRASPTKRGVTGKGKGPARKGSMAAALIDVDDLDDNDGSAAVNDGWPAGTRARFETRLPEFFSPRFGGYPPARIAHAVVVELHQCLIEDVDAEMAGVVVKGASDSQLRGYMLTSGTLSTAQVAKWMCCAMTSTIRFATLPSMAMALERVVNKAAAKDATASGVGVAAAAARAAAGPFATAAPRGCVPRPATAADAVTVPPVRPGAAVVPTLTAVYPTAAGSTPASSGIPPVAATTKAATVEAGERSC